MTNDEMEKVISFNNFSFNVNTDLSYTDVNALEYIFSSRSLENCRL